MALSSSYVWTAGGDSWLLEETAQNKTTANHTNKRYIAGLLFAQQFYLGADLFIIRHLRESTHPAGITPQGFLKTNTVLWLCFGKVEDCFRSQLPFKGRNSFKVFQSGGGGSCTHAHSVPSYTSATHDPLFRSSNQKEVSFSLDTYYKLRSMSNRKNWNLNPLPVR